MLPALSIARSLKPVDFSTLYSRPGMPVFMLKVRTTAIDTDMVDADTPMEKILEVIPMQRIGKPEEVAAAVSFLVSADAAYVTRQVISVNGGLC